MIILLLSGSKGTVSFAAQNIRKMKRLVYLMMILLVTSFMACKSGANLGKDVDYTCKGDSPFWTVVIAKEGIVFTLLGGKESTFPYVKPEESDGRIVYVTKKDQTWLRISLNEGNCLNSVAGKQYPYQAEVSVGDTVYLGCAE